MRSPYSGIKYLLSGFYPPKKEKKSICLLSDGLRTGTKCKSDLYLNKYILEGRPEGSQVSACDSPIKHPWCPPLHQQKLHLLPSEDRTAQQPSNASPRRAWHDQITSHYLSVTCPSPVGRHREPPTCFIQSGEIFKVWKTNLSRKSQLELIAANMLCLIIKE